MEDTSRSLSGSSMSSILYAGQNTCMVKHCYRHGSLFGESDDVHIEEHLHSRRGCEYFCFFRRLIRAQGQTCLAPTDGSMVVPTTEDDRNDLSLVSSAIAV